MSTPPITLITGASGGIGRAISRRAAALGRPLVLCGRDADALGEWVEVLRADVSDAPPMHVAIFDLLDADAMRAALDEARGVLGGPVLDLVLNAGIAISAPVTRSNLERDLWALHMDVNFHAPRRLIELCLPAMLLARRGRIVSIASSAALRGYAYVAAYSASKHALLGLTRSLSLELEAKGIGCSAVCPHYVDSPMTDASIARVARKTGQSLESARAFFASENPGGVLVSPDEVAQVAIEQLEAHETGEVLELIGGARRLVDPGRALPANTPTLLEGN